MKGTKKSTSPVTIRELKSAADWAALYPLIAQLNKDMPKAQFTKRLKEMRARGYRCAGVFEGKKMLGALGFWIGMRFWCGRNIDLDNAVVLGSQRSKGIGSQLVAWVEAIGKKEGCELAVLDSYTTAHKAHRFYHREGYKILGYHFTKDL